MFDRVKQFFIERAKWKKAGSPRRTNKEINILFDICKSCDEYKKKNDIEGKCGLCGCRLTNVKSYWNKLTWATTRCPLDEPKWLEQPAYQVNPVEVTEEEIQSEEKLGDNEPDNPPKKGGCGCGK